KVGGIHTVISSKAGKMKENFKEYYAIGPYYENKAQTEFEEKEVPEKFRKCFEELEKETGIKCRFGEWLIPGKNCHCILVEFNSIRPKINEIKRELWEKFRIDSLGTNGWFDEPVLWGRAVGMLIEKLVKANVFNGVPAVAHFHEFLSGTGLLYLKEKNIPIKTVFTIHATVLGRTIAESKRENLYDLIERGNKEKRSADNSLAYNYWAQAKHLLEKASAINADCFTTVSAGVANEAEFILGKKPDLITPNGLDMEQFPIMEEISILHRQNRDRIREFVEAYFSPYYYFDVNNTFVYFITGRREFHNKGIDLFIDSLGELNRRLIHEKSEKTVVAFIWIAEEVTARNFNVMENLAVYQMLEDAVEMETPKIKRALFETLIKGKHLKKADLFDEEFIENTKRIVLKFKRMPNELPPISAFDVNENEITWAIKKNNLLNRKEDKVKVIYYPTYLSPADGFIGLSYYAALTGGHLGVFPSYYEPWGYTPLETAALGVPAVTTDFAGFGQFIEEKRKKKGGIIVLNRKEKPKEEVQELTRIMHSFCKKNRRERMREKMHAKELAGLADWGSLIKEYSKAYACALKK
ncbi:glycogen/starch synthase, partial [Candidatus Micrarchaeota archaeon]|nr:glycogen/starch synthase [Candidatus Micrarchaeota archaeon]